MDTEKLKKVMKVFIISQLNCFPLLWMFCERRLNNKINNFPEKALRIQFKNEITDFQILLERGNAVKIDSMKRTAIKYGDI